MLSDLQKEAAQSIVNIFETGKVLGDYSSLVSVLGDPGGLTYGRSQTTLMSGNLFLLIKAYCNAENAELAEELRPYLIRLGNKDISLNKDRTLRNYLRESASDPVMQKTQDEFFDRVYWNPAVKSAIDVGIQIPLGIAVVYDSIIHGSWGKMRDRTLQTFGTTSSTGEKAWIKHYIDTRRDWLASHPTVPLLHKTVYRMDAFKKLISEGNWDLSLPFTIRGLTVDEQTLARQGIVSAQVDEVRFLRLQSPFIKGEDVRQVQEALNNAGFSISEIDGIYGSKTESAVKSFQASKGLVVDGIVGPATYAELGL